MKRILFVMAFVAMLLTSLSALAFEAGDEVELCHEDSGYVLASADSECTGELISGTVKEAGDGAVVVELPEGGTVSVPVE